MKKIFRSITDWISYIMFYIQFKTFKSKPFDFLRKYDDALIMNLIICEHPQIIALILCHLPEKRVAKILNQFPDDLAGEVLTRISNFGEVSEAVIKRVSAVLESKFEKYKKYKKYKEIGGHQSTKKIIQSMDLKQLKHVQEYLHVKEDFILTQNRLEKTTFKKWINNLKRKYIKYMAYVLIRKGIKHGAKH